MPCEILMRQALKQQPRGLYILFFAELWERFSYYGMRALFILYMTNAFLFSDEKSYTIYGIYGTLVYVTPILGGFFADRVIGYRRAVILGGILMAIGQFTLTIEALPYFYTGLALLIVGNGLLKPNLASILGKLYTKDDPRRDSGFTIYYVGINIGSFLAPLFCGYIGQEYGWHYGFGLAGIGMILGLIVFVGGQKYLEGHGESPQLSLLHKRILPAISFEKLLYATVILIVVLTYLVIQTTLTGIILLATCIIVFGVIVMMAFASDRVTRNHLLALVSLMIFSMCFWSFCEQAGSSLNLFTERNINRHIFGHLIPASMFQAINPLFIFLLGPLFSMLWLRLDRNKTNISTGIKFSLGLLQLGLGFYLMALGAKQAETIGHASVWWLVWGYLLMTSGELFIEPIGMSMVTRLSPPRMVGMLMGTWFLIDGAISNFVAAQLAQISSAPIHLANDATVTAHLYYHLFTEIALAAIIISLFIFMYSPFLKRLINSKA